MGSLEVQNLAARVVPVFDGASPDCDVPQTGFDRAQNQVLDKEPSVIHLQMGPRNHSHLGDQHLPFGQRPLHHQRRHL